MTKPTTILVQNIEDFTTITVCDNDDAFDTFMENNDAWGIVSLEDDVDGEHAAVALLAPADGPDYDPVDPAPVTEILDGTEFFQVVDLNAEREAKLDIAMEIDEPETITLPEAVAELMTETAPPKPRKTRNKSKKSNTGAKMKAHEHLVALITSNPGISRTVVFNDKGLRAKLLSPAVIAKIDAGDKLEVKRWNRRLNRFIRQMKRDGLTVNIERIGRVAHYTIGTPSTDVQLELPFTEAAEARNEALFANDDDNEVLEAPVKIDFRRATEPENVDLSFEDLLATLDDEAVADDPTITRDGE